MTTATTTRDASYHNLTDLGEKQAAVLAVIAERGPINNRAIAEALGWDVNRVTPRVFELRERGLVVEAGTAWDGETNRSVTLWGMRQDNSVPPHRTDFNRPGLPPILSAGMASTPSNDATPTKTPKTALRALETLSGDLPQKREIPLGQRLWFADKAAREAGLENYWIELYRLVAIATSARELAYAFEVIEGYKANATKGDTEEYVRKEYLIIKDLATWKQKELKNEMR